MNNYFKNHTLILFSFFIMSAFGMEENTIPSTKIAAKFVALGLTKEVKSATTIAQKSLLLEQDRQNAQNWLKATEPAQKDPHLQQAYINHLAKYGLAQNFYEFNYITPVQTQLNGAKTILNFDHPERPNKPPFKHKGNRSRRAATPLPPEKYQKENQLEHINPVFHNEKIQKIPNCLLM